MDSDSERPYTGLLVLDASQGVAGPYCPAILGQYGAEVIKIEPPKGDWVRKLGTGIGGMSALSIASNLGKRSISLDATRPEGRAIILKMAERADVFVENYRPGVTARLGLDHATLASINPRLIYVSITGFGESGPYADKPGSDTVLQALTGMAAANRDASGMPRCIGILVPDTITAMYAAQA